VLDVLHDVGDYDVPLARAVSILEEEDAHMRTHSPVPYIDSTANGWDLLRSMTPGEARTRIYEIAHVVLTATHASGDAV
jgi:hypothetical protein